MALLRLKLTEFVAPPDACHFARARFTQTRPFGPHTHDFVEVFWVENGEGWHVINRRKRALRTGMVVFVRAEDRHEFSCAHNSACLEIANLAFAARAWERLRRRYYPAQEVAWASPALERREFDLSTRAFRQLHAAAGKLSAGARGLAALDGFLLNLLDLIWSASPRGTTRPAALNENPPPSWLLRACEQFQRHSENLAPGVLALVQAAARSPAHVSRQFQRHLGCTPTQWVNHQRMSHAAERLAGSDAKILDIIADCGIQNPRHFYALFQARFGLTPGEFRLREQRVLKPFSKGR